MIRGMTMDRIHANGSRFTDEYGRERIFNGVNVCDKGNYVDGRYEYAHEWDDERLDKMAETGVNIVRLGTTWDAIESYPGEYNDGYIDALVKIADKCAERGIYVYLDMHQDLYSGFGGLAGDGAPKWACKTGGKKAKPHKLVWAEGYFFPGATMNAFSAFWDNEPVRGKGLQEYYADMWAHLAEKFNGHPALFGYDIMNEPFPGKDGWKIFSTLIKDLVKTTVSDKRLSVAKIAETALSGKPYEVLGFYKGDILKTVTRGASGVSARFDGDKYSPFLDKVSTAIRNAGGDGILFADNNYYSNLGIPCAATAIHTCGKRDGNQCFAPHAYDFTVDTPLYQYADNSRLETIFAEHRRTQQRLGVPVIVGEWGGNSEGTLWLPHIEFLLALFDSYKWSFTYWEDCAYLDNPDLNAVLKRPYPRAVCGNIEKYVHDRENDTFTLEWTQDKAYKVPTEIFVPAPPTAVSGGWKYALDGNVLRVKGKKGFNSITIRFGDDKNV